MAYEMQDVLSTDMLRQRCFFMTYVHTTTTDDALSWVVVAGLPDTGGTIVEVWGAMGTTPTGTTAGAYMVVETNGATIFTATGSSLNWPKTATGRRWAHATAANIKAAKLKVFNGDIFSMDGGAIGNGAAGANPSVCVVVRADCPND